MTPSATTLRIVQPSGMRNIRRQLQNAIVIKLTEHAGYVVPIRSAIKCGRPTQSATYSETMRIGCSPFAGLSRRTCHPSPSRPFTSTSSSTATQLSL